MRGDIVVFPRGNSDWQGHVAYVLKADAQYVYAFGGNQDNAVNLTRYSRAKVLGFRRPVARKIILDIQAKLRDLGFNAADNVDGVLGPKTKKAIAAYETAKGFAPFDNMGSLHRHLTAPAKPDPAPAAPKPTPVPAPPVVSAKRGKLGWWLLGIVIIAALIIAAFTIRF
jgi:peptidoglycan hydrolase-like protein with peptidoglycan-binding domain